MASDDTWIPAYRKLFEPDHNLALGKPVCPRFAWLDLCQMATRDARCVSHGSEPIELDRGELVTSLRTLGERWRWDKMAVSRFLRGLEKRDTLRKQRETPAGTVYIVVAHNTYWLDRDTIRDSNETPPETEARQQRDKNKKAEEGKEVTREKKNPSGKKKRRGSQIPDDWRPNEHHRDLAWSRGVDLEEEWSRFRDHHLAKGTTFKDWDRAFNNWIRKARDFQRNGQPHPDSEAAKVKADGPAAERPQASIARRQGPDPLNGSSQEPTPEQVQRAMTWAQQHRQQALELWEQGKAEMGEVYQTIRKKNEQKARALAETRFTRLLIKKGVVS